MYKPIIALSVMLMTAVIAAGLSNQTALAEPTGDAADGQHAQVITVKKGDYLDKLAKDNGTTYLRLFYANQEISDPDLIYPGMELRVPDASEELTPRVLPENAPVSAQIEANPTRQQAAAPVAQTQAPAPAPAPAAVVPAGTSVWDQLAACESGGNWAINTGNGFYGGLQFTLSSWQAVGGSGYPNQASRSEQIYRGQILQARQGWGAWPACSAKLGLR